jgi:homoserine dehydrogenase
MLGCGVVGSEVARLILADTAELSTRAGAKIELAKIAVREIRPRPGIPNELFTLDAMSIVNDPTIDLIIEVMGGIEPARELILQAISNRKSIVTANKALLASHGADLFTAAYAQGEDIYYEAAVAGAIPIIRPMRDSLAGDHVVRLMGIVNGTTNYILTKMHEDNREFADVLAEAQKLGYAEADPTADVEGFDAAAKAAILSGLAFHTRVTVEDVYREGISSITLEDVQIAKSMDHVIKLLAIAELTPADEISVRVHPVLLHKSHPLASVRDAFNAVFIEAESAGPLMFYGRGAGGAPLH